MSDDNSTGVAKAKTPSLTRDHLVGELKLRCGLGRRQAKVLIECIFNAMVAALQRGEAVQIRGLGTLKSRERGSRFSRNPQTGIMVQVPAKRVIAFKPSRHITHGEPDDGAQD